MSEEPKPSENQEIDHLIAWCKATQFSTRHAAGWRNLLAADLNQILDRLGYGLETEGPAIGTREAQALRRVIERVADFERIERCPN